MTDYDDDGAKWQHWEERGCVFIALFGQQPQNMPKDDLPSSHVCFYGLPMTVRCLTFSHQFCCSTQTSPATEPVEGMSPVGGPPYNAPMRECGLFEAHVVDVSASAAATRPQS
jgi:hypothetical protein